MNFYGSVGYIMAGSGIQSLLELIYAEHTVPHIFLLRRLLVQLELLL